MARGHKFGIVGAGRAAASYAEAFAGCAEADLVAVADTRFDAARAMAEAAHCSSYDSYKDMVDACSLDAAVVCTPPVTHPEICIDLLNRGVHVLCEKPLSFDVVTAREMFAAAHRNTRQFTMASKFRYVEDIIQARRIVGSGMIGEVVLCENVFATRVDMSTRWNSRPEVSGGGVLIDNGTHSVDLLTQFIGPLAEIHVWEGKRSQGLHVEETVSMFVRSVSGVIGNVDLSWSINKHRSSYLDIYGSDGAISIGWKDCKLFDYSKDEVMSFGSGYSRVQAFRNQIENFCRAIDGKQSLLVTEEDAIASVNVINVAYAALRQNCWTPVRPSWEAVPADCQSLRTFASA